MIEKSSLKMVKIHEKLMLIIFKHQITTKQKHTNSKQKQSHLQDVLHHDEW